ncbi:ABC transporter-like protein [Cercophora scortea]|uniref:ABC transporter-like protein n=1 Tax=Cercophora scortea TaxID=314031 RepID=A0AAE0IWV2_9PEZI|nr:ABC transporter-like protein [Cercophora scortea]
MAGLVSAGVYSILISRSEEELVILIVRGPGGKPLPATRRKRRYEQPRVRDVYSGAFARCARGLSGYEWPWWCGEERIVYIVGSAALYVFVLSTLFEWSDSPNISYCIFWTFGLVGEAIILLSFAFTIFSSHHVVHSVGTRVLEPAEGADIWDFLDLGIGAVRLGLLTLLSVPLLNGNSINYYTQLPYKLWFEYCCGYLGVVLLCFILVIGTLADVVGPSGLLGSLRSILWNIVSQHIYRAFATAAFEHRTGEVLLALNKVTFQALPMFVDLVVAIIYFYIRFGPKYALFVSRRDMVNADREEEAVKSDSIILYETVAEAKVTWGINYMSVCQLVVFLSGFFVTMMTCAFEVTQGKRTVGDFTILLIYSTQLRGPLSSFGTLYRTIQQAMISSERLLELFKIQPTVVDKPDAKPLLQCSGHVKWNNVGFTYSDDNSGAGRALHNLSFECKPGTTTAFVGESGGGKSTGSIEIDGRDVEDLAIDSVRRYVSVVPQDITLSNGTLMYNLKYANPIATDEDVFEACHAAGIHDRILSFSDGYLTEVGERGLRLSGGEKQRVAIARMILKKPKVIMLDEATSALDGETERKIQSKLISGSFGQDCTLLIIAHRLSTITHADQIVVLHAGTAVEKGTHDELLALKGRYASMWENECTTWGAGRLLAPLGKSPSTQRILLLLASSPMERDLSNLIRPTANEPSSGNTCFRGGRFSIQLAIAPTPGAEHQTMVLSPPPTMGVMLQSAYHFSRCEALLLR